MRRNGARAVLRGGGAGNSTSLPDYGKAIPLERGGPVRMIVPWAHGFKSIKWLQRISLTNEYRAMDTYAAANNDPESYLKTAAYIDGNAENIPAGRPVVVTGTVMVGLPGV